MTESPLAPDLPTAPPINPGGGPGLGRLFLVPLLIVSVLVGCAALVVLMFGWIGTGKMGYPMAARLIGAGVDVTVYNRTKAKAEPLGVTVVDTPADLADRDPGGLHDGQHALRDGRQPGGSTQLRSLLAGVAQLPTQLSAGWKDGGRGCRAGRPQRGQLRVDRENLTRHGEAGSRRSRGQGRLLADR